MGLLVLSGAPLPRLIYMVSIKFDKTLSSMPHNTAQERRENMYNDFPRTPDLFRNITAHCISRFIREYLSKEIATLTKCARIRKDYLDDLTG